jgi:N-acetylglucosaminyldiphosphoundecaprenol N-acetyl-beta-D-mannosaminyltransferase
VRRIDIFGIPVVAESRRVVVDEIRHRVTARRRGYVCCANVHVVETAQRDSTLASALCEAALVVPDGAPIAWLVGARSRRPIERIAGADLFEALCREAGYRHFLLGSTADTLRSFEREMRARFPKAEVAGTHAPSFGDLEPAELQEIASSVNVTQPHIVWVGMGAPKQEVLMQRLRPMVEAPVLVGVGAVFDFYAGTRPRAPHWMQSSGLEWLHRLLHEPARLSRRYLRTNTTFLLRLLRGALTPSG